MNLKQLMNTLKEGGIQSIITNGLNKRNMFYSPLMQCWMVRDEDGNILAEDENYNKCLKVFLENK